MRATFKTFLLEKAHVGDKYVTYYLRWVSACFLNGPPLR